MARTAWLREPAAAAFLDVAPRTLRDYRSKRLIPFTRLGGPRGRVRYSQYDLDKFAEAYKVEAKP